jgi:hypothetical protein
MNKKGDIQNVFCISTQTTQIKQIFTDNKMEKRAKGERAKARKGERYKQRIFSRGLPACCLQPATYSPFTCPLIKK